MFAFLLGPIGRWLGVAAIIAALCGTIWIQHKWSSNKITKLEQRFSGLELKAEILEKAQKATDAYIQKRTTIQRKVTSDKTQIDQVVESGDNAALRKLYIDRGLLRPQKTNPAPGRTKGNS